MPEFKCISCGEIKEGKSVCSCPNCGYRMFKMPYERGAVLRSEIESFVSRLEVKTAVRNELVFEGKSKDDMRFPDYAQILKYVSGRERTEAFLNNLQETVKQLRTHFCSDFSKSYPVSYKKLEERIEKYDKILYSAAEHFFLPKQACIHCRHPASWSSESGC